MHQVSVIVVGAGLAGTSLAWSLRKRGLGFLLLDRAEAVTSSRVAAGLMTPITGKRLTKSWRHDDFFPVAAAFYRAVEAETGQRFFFPRPIVRIFQTAKESATFEKHRSEFGGLVREPSPPLNPRWFHAPPVGFEMPTAAQLDVPAYLDASRTAFEKRGQFLVADVSPDDLQLTPAGVSLPRFGLHAKHLVYCQGLAATQNPLTCGLPFRAAKGEILTVRIPDYDEVRVLNTGHWLAPQSPGLWRFGATYSWHDFTNATTVEARTELKAALRKLLACPFEIVGQQAAVRPIIAGQRPVLGFLNGSPVGVFNGLGSKGSLMAPFFAEQFAARLAGTGTLESEVSGRFPCISA